MLSTRQWVNDAYPIWVVCAAPKQNRALPYGAAFNAPRHPGIVAMRVCQGGPRRSSGHGSPPLPSILIENCVAYCKK